MTKYGPSSLQLRSRRPSPLLGVLVSVAGVAAATGLIYPLKNVAPVDSLSPIYLLVVVAVSVFWGLGFGVVTAVLSVASYTYFHLPPVGHFTLSDSRDWIGLTAFVAVAVAVGLLAELARSRALEADERRREADLASQIAQLLLGADRLDDALPLASARLAEAIGAGQAEIVLGEADPVAGMVAIELHGGEGRLGVLLLPGSLSEADRTRVRNRVVPSLESILAAAMHRAALQAELVETDALRRSDEIKTAVLRSVSHDLRTPVTAILTAAETLDPVSPAAENVAEVREVVVDAATRLWRLIEKVLDLSLLQAGELERGAAVCSIEEVLHEAAEQTGQPNGTFQLSVDRELPLLRGDPAQLERAFANVLENSARFSAGKPVSIRARVVTGRLRVRIVDQGPGITEAEQDRVFLPFYRVPGPARTHQGSGLGLAIARGFVEANGGRISVESSPGHGTSFVIEFPLSASGSPAAATPGREAPAQTVI